MRSHARARLRRRRGHGGRIGAAIVVVARGALRHVTMRHVTRRDQEHRLISAGPAQAQLQRHPHARALHRRLQRARGAGGRAAAGRHHVTWAQARSVGGAAWNDAHHAHAALAARGCKLRRHLRDWKQKEQAG